MLDFIKMQPVKAGTLALTGFRHFELKKGIIVRKKARQWILTDL